jgi:uncharacterized membrane-anchored protein
MAVVELLVSKMVDFETKEDISGSTALHLAAREGNRNVVAFLAEQVNMMMMMMMMMMIILIIVVVIITIIITIITITTTTTITRARTHHCTRRSRTITRAPSS